MKRIVLITCLLFAITFVSVVSAGDTIVKPFVPEEIPLTFTKMYEDVKEGIAGLASALKAPVEHVYAVLVKQQIVQAWASLLAIILCFSTVWIVPKIFKKAIEAVESDIEADESDIEADESDSGPSRPGDNSYRIASLIISIVMLIISVIIFLCLFEYVVYGLFNPEYGAIKDIMNFIR